MNSRWTTNPILKNGHVVSTRLNVSGDLGSQVFPTIPSAEKQPAQGWSVRNPWLGVWRPVHKTWEVNMDRIERLRELLRQKEEILGELDEIARQIKQEKQLFQAARKPRKPHKQKEAA